MTENHARISSAHVETIAGFAGGTFSTLAVHPLDVIKTRLHSMSATSYTMNGADNVKFSAVHLRFQSMPLGFSKRSWPINSLSRACIEVLRRI
jgi:hypothetical protein